jgi:rRNA maturation endonuclease Nob1
MAERNIFLLKAALSIKLSKLGFDVAICHNCGRIFDKTKGETLCKDCQE